MSQKPGCRLVDFLPCPYEMQGNGLNIFIHNIVLDLITMITDVDDFSSHAYCHTYEVHQIRTEPNTTGKWHPLLQGW